MLLNNFSKMKTNKISIYFLLIFSLVLTGCGNDDRDVAKQKDSITMRIADQEQFPNTNEEEAMILGNAMDMMGELKDKKEMSNIIKSFELETPTYLRCLNDSVANCQYTAVQEEIRTAKNVKACDYLSDDSLKENCHDQAWLQISIESDDQGLCNKIKKDSLEKECNAALYLKEAIKNNSDVVCEKNEEATRQKQCKNNYYLAMAREKTDESYCEKLLPMSDERMDGGMLDYQKMECIEAIKMEKGMMLMEADMLQEIEHLDTVVKETMEADKDTPMPEANIIDGIDMATLEEDPMGGGNIILPEADPMIIGSTLEDMDLVMPEADPMGFSTSEATPEI